MVPNLHINSVLPHHSCESRALPKRKTKHRPSNLMKNGPEKHINASSGTRRTSGKHAPREQWFPGKGARHSPREDRNVQWGGPESRGDGPPAASHGDKQWLWKSFKGEEKKTDSLRGVESLRWKSKVASGWCELAQEHRSPLRVRRGRNPEPPLHL